MVGHFLPFMVHQFMHHAGHMGAHIGHLLHPPTEAPRNQLPGNHPSPAELRLKHKVTELQRQGFGEQLSTEIAMQILHLGSHVIAQQAAAQTLRQYAARPDGGSSSRAIIAGGGVKVLVQLLASDSEGVRKEAALALAIILASGDDARAALVNTGGVLPLVRQLHNTNPCEQYTAAWALCALAEGAEACKAAIVAVGGEGRLVQLLSSRDVDVQQNAILALANITASSNADNRDAVVSAGGVQKVLQYLNSSTRQHRPTPGSTDELVQQSAAEMLSQLQQLQGVDIAH